jgi:hypothetical protein
MLSLWTADFYVYSVGQELLREGEELWWKKINGECMEAVNKG